MNIKRFFPPLLLLALILVSSCYYDNIESLYPELNSACDTTTVTFSGSVAPLLSARCYSCHSNTTAASFGGNIKVENYADVTANATAIAGSVKHESSYSPMPKNGGKLDACSIKLIDIWIREGKADN